MHHLQWKETADSLLIPVPDIFNFEVNLGYLKRDEQECLYMIDQKQITTLIETEETTVLVTISGKNNQPLEVKKLLPQKQLTIHEKEQIVHYIADWFDLTTDIGPFYKIVENDPLLRPLLPSLYGLRIIGVPSLFEALCWAVLGQQINLAFAYRLKRDFIQTFGHSITYDNETYWTFPKVQDIAVLTTEQLLQVKMTKRKSEYIINIAKQIANEELSKTKLLQINDMNNIEKSLVNIRGIGPWTANYCMMRCLRDPNAFPVADVGLLNAVKRFKNLAEKPSKAEMLELSKSWTGYKAYATFYLWRGNNVL